MKDKVMKQLEKILNGTEVISRIFFYIGAVALVIMFILVFLDVTLRLLINHPVNGTDVYASYLMVAVGFLALGYGELNGAHVKMEYFGEKFFGAFRKYLQLIVLLIVIAFFVIMTMQIGARANSDRIAKILISNSNLPLPVWWQSAIATAGSGMLVLALIVEFIRKLLAIVLKLPEKPNSIISEKQGA